MALRKILGLMAADVGKPQVSEGDESNIDEDSFFPDKSPATTDALRKGPSSFQREQH
jgi:hypothetical protein